MSSSLAGQKYETAAGVERLATELTRRLESLPGVQAATYALALPLQFGPDMPFNIAGKPPSGGDTYNPRGFLRNPQSRHFQVAHPYTTPLAGITANADTILLGLPKPG
jgi:hypothetical protein